LEAAAHQVKLAKEVIKTDVSTWQTGAAPFQLTCPSVCSGPDDDDCHIWQPSADVAENALETLVALLPADSIVRLFNRPAACTAAIALKAIGWALKKAIQQLLNKAKRARDKTWVPSGLDSEVLTFMHSMQVSLSFAQNVLQHLCGVHTNSLDQFSQQLSEIISEADGFIKEIIGKEIEDWLSTKPGAKGWPLIFSYRLKKAKQLMVFDPAKIGETERKMRQQIKGWHDNCSVKAHQASEDDENWEDFIEHAVRQGLDYEGSNLQTLLRYPLKFEPLVVAQAKQLQKTAESAQPSQRLAVWKRLTAFITALQLCQNGNWIGHVCNQLIDVRKPLDADLHDIESLFSKALQDNQFLEACR